MARTYERFINRLKARWMSNPCYRPPIEGCTPEEIELIRRSQGVSRLPELYTELMLQMGRADGGLSILDHAEMCFPYITNFKDNKRDWSGPVFYAYIPFEDTFVFATNHAEFLYWFFVDEDDPVVHYISEKSGFDPDDWYNVGSLDRLSMWLIDRVEICFPLESSTED